MLYFLNYLGCNVSLDMMWLDVQLKKIITVEFFFSFGSSKVGNLRLCSYAATSWNISHENSRELEIEGKSNKKIFNDNLNPDLLQTCW